MDHKKYVCNLQKNFHGNGIANNCEGRSAYVVQNAFFESMDPLSSKVHMTPK